MTSNRFDRLGRLSFFLRIFGGTEGGGRWLGLPEILNVPGDLALAELDVVVFF